MAIHNTFVIERDYPVSAERLFAGLAEPDLKRRWFAAGDVNELLEFEMDFRVGGREVTRSRLGAGSPVPGAEMMSEGVYLDIEWGRRVVMGSAMTFGGRRISAALVTFEVSGAGAGSRVKMTHQAAFFEGADGPEMRRAGWEFLLGRLGETVG